MLNVMIGLLLFVPAPTAEDEPDPQTLEGRFGALVEQYESKERSFLRAYRDAKTKEEKRKIAAEMRVSLNDAEYARRFRAMALEDPKAPSTPDALLWAANLGRPGPEAEEAIELLRRDHATSPRMAYICYKLGSRVDSIAEPLFRAVLEKNPDHDAQGHACLALASLLCEAAEVPRIRAESLEMAKKVEDFYGEGPLVQLLKRDHRAMHEEAVALYERVVAQYADVRWNLSDSKDLRTIKKPAETWLAGYRELAVGRPAPEIEGKDIDGKPFRLSDYRGKVLVLVFWATWCKPCMALVPQERELAKRMAGDRFALLGVNCDSKKEAMREALAEEKITWPNWYDGGLGSGPIAERYRVQGIPAIYVIDPEGVIRNKDVRGATLDSAIQKLMREMGTMPTERQPPAASSVSPP